MKFTIFFLLLLISFNKTPWDEWPLLWVEPDNTKEKQNRTKILWSFSLNLQMHWRWCIRPHKEVCLFVSAGHATQQLDAATRFSSSMPWVNELQSHEKLHLQWIKLLLILLTSRFCEMCICIFFIWAHFVESYLYVSVWINVIEITKSGLFLLSQVYWKMLSCQRWTEKSLKLTEPSQILVLFLALEIQDKLVWQRVWIQWQEGDTICLLRILT